MSVAFSGILIREIERKSIPGILQWRRTIVPALDVEVTELKTDTVRTGCLSLSER